MRRISVVVLVALVIGGLGAAGYAIYQQTVWGQHLWASLRHARATATVVARTDMRAQATATAQTFSDNETLASVHADLKLAHGTATAQADQITNLQFELPPSPTPTPKTPYIQICFQEDLDKGKAICNSDYNSFYSESWPDIGLAFVVPPSALFTASTIKWRVYKPTAGGGDTLLGNYTDNSVDPQSPGFTWLVPYLFNRVDTSGLDYTVTAPPPGTYKIEMLDQQGKFIAAATFTLMPSSFASTVTPTP